MNTQIITEWRDAVKSLINEPMPKPVPVIEVNPKLTQSLKLRTLLKSTTGSADIIPTTSNTKQLYIKAVVFNMIKDSTCDVATGNLSLSCTIDGAVKELVLIPVITLTAQSMSVTVCLDNPIKIDTNTAVTFGAQTFTAGVMIRTANIYFYEDDYSKA
jgi:hypothetical protein